MTKNRCVKELLEGSVCLGHLAFEIIVSLTVNVLGSFEKII